LNAENISEASARDLWRPLIILFLMTTVLLLLLRFLTGDWWRAGLVLSFLLLMFFSYGHAYNFLKENLQLNDVAIGDVYLFRHPVLVIVWVVLMCVGSFFLLRIRDLRPPTLFLNSVAILMLVFPAYNIALHMYREHAYGSRTNVQTASLHVPEGSPLPDVYFIVLDAYGRKDVLQETFELDNSDF
jgi:glucan phosphoethanolaminetransferase (alkaline phosphatase superfamily)